MDTKFISLSNGANQIATPLRASETPRKNEASAILVEKLVTGSNDEIQKQDNVQQVDFGGPKSRDEVQELVRELNTKAQNHNRTLRFSIDEKLGRSVISVVDRETDEVIRQIPPETACPGKYLLP